MNESEWRSNKLRIDQRMFKATPVLLPPLTAQQDALHRVGSPFALADQIETRLTAAQRQADTLAPSLLARACCGKLIPQHPPDHAVSGVLERIWRPPKPQSP